MENKKVLNIKATLTRKEKFIISLSTLILVSIIIYLYINWADMPEIIPAHFGFSGAPDKFANKKSLIAMPIIVSITHIVLLIVSRFPKLYNYPIGVTERNAESIYKIGKQLIIIVDMEMSILFCILIWQNIQAALGKIHGINVVLLFSMIGIISITVIYETMRIMKNY